MALSHPYIYMKLTNNSDSYVPGKDQVRHDGEYVLTKEGNKDFGEISQEIAQKIRRQAGKIRLRIGKQEENGNNYGENILNAQIDFCNLERMVTKMREILFRMSQKTIIKFTLEKIIV